MGQITDLGQGQCFTCRVSHVLRFFPRAEGAHGGGEAADTALFGLSELLGLQHQSDGASPGRGRQHLL